uniref:Uncharacterized protein n=1 Tax=Oryza nivara TaxID=4536 RepID=A0A0E0FLJ6_ORYNI
MGSSSLYVDDDDNSFCGWLYLHPNLSSKIRIRKILSKFGEYRFASRSWYDCRMWASQTAACVPIKLAESDLESVFVRPRNSFFGWHISGFC